MHLNLLSTWNSYMYEQCIVESVFATLVRNRSPFSSNMVRVFGSLSTVLGLKPNVYDSLPLLAPLMTFQLYFPVLQCYHGVMREIGQVEWVCLLHSTLSISTLKLNPVEKVWFAIMVLQLQKHKLMESFSVACCFGFICRGCTQSRWKHPQTYGYHLM